MDMTNDKPITDSIKNVAEALGWDLEHADRLGHRATVWLPNRHFACQWTIGEFAAHVKAALAVRGIYILILMPIVTTRVNGVITTYQYDPADPISESHAIILSAESALVSTDIQRSYNDRNGPNEGRE